ncbi:hypothetical protein Ancab_035722 [Ancistrocladus abbreviatus]
MLRLRDLLGLAYSEVITSTLKIKINGELFIVQIIEEIRVNDWFNMILDYLLKIHDVINGDSSDEMNNEKREGFSDHSEDWFDNEDMENTIGGDIEAYGRKVEDANMVEFEGDDMVEFEENALEYSMQRNRLSMQIIVMTKNGSPSRKHWRRLSLRQGSRSELGCGLSVGWITNDGSSELSKFSCDEYESQALGKTNSGNNTHLRTI